MPFTPFSTSAALKTDALRIAGEPQDGSSPYDDVVYDWLSVVQNTLISGGMLGPSPLLPIDWLWARKYPRGTVLLTLPYNGAFTNTATFTLGSDIVTLANPLVPGVDPNLINWRTLVGVSESPIVRPYIVEIITPTSFRLHDPWSSASITTANWLAFQAEFDLPDDFVRFVSPLYASGWPYRIDVVEPNQLEKSYPFSLITSAIPVLAAMVAPLKLRFSHFIGTQVQGSPANVPLLLEFEYIARPEPIAEGTLPIVPPEHTRVLSYGAAFLIADDKMDNDRDRLYGRFAAQYKALIDEYRMNLYKGSSRWGAVIPRTVDEPRRLRTESGLIVW